MWKILRQKGCACPLTTNVMWLDGAHHQASVKEALVSEAIHLNSRFAFQLCLGSANAIMICDLRDVTAFLCFHSRWWGWENWLSRLRTANSALSARHPSSLRLNSHWRRTITLASCKRLKISLKGKEDVPLDKQKNLSLRQMGCHSCHIVLSHHKCGQRERGELTHSPKTLLCAVPEWERPYCNAKPKHPFEKRSSRKRMRNKS